jgi:hypothetical protein
LIQVLGQLEDQGKPLAGLIAVSSTIFEAGNRWVFDVIPVAIFSIIIATTDHFFDIRTKNDSLFCQQQKTARSQIVLTCSNWAVYDPFLSTNGGYASTMPLDTRLFNWNQSDFLNRKVSWTTYPKKILLLAQSIQISPTKR